MRREFADGTVCPPEEDKTRQSEKDQADINKIMKRAEMSGIMPLSDRVGEFLDVSEAIDYREMRERMRKVDEYFMSLPADSRGVFNNDPDAFVDAVNSADPDAVEKLKKAGVIPKEDVVVPVGGAGAPVAAPSGDVKQ